MSNDETKAYCRWCAIVLRAHKTDLTTHAATAKHAKNAQTGGPSPAGPISVQLIANDEEQIKYSQMQMQQQYDSLGNLRPGIRSPYTKKYRRVWESIPELKS